MKITRNEYEIVEIILIDKLDELYEEATFMEYSETNEAVMKALNILEKEYKDEEAYMRAKHD